MSIDTDAGICEETLLESPRYAKSDPILPPYAFAVALVESATIVNFDNAGSNMSTRRPLTSFTSTAPFVSARTPAMLENSGRLCRDGANLPDGGRCCASAGVATMASRAIARKALVERIIGSEDVAMFNGYRLMMMVRSPPPPTAAVNTSPPAKMGPAPPPKPPVNVAVPDLIDAR